MMFPFVSKLRVSLRREIVVATVICTLLAPLALASNLEPRAIEVLGPQSAAIAPQRQQIASNLGGGFLEMLVRGGQTAPRSMPLQPRAAPSISRNQVPSAQFQRQEVPYDGREAAGTLVVDTPNRFLYYVEGDGRATRYGIGVGRPGFEWSGVEKISRKVEWPTWTPPASMFLRRPNLPKFMPGGENNPLGARALYLGSTLYRIHGTNEPWSIGTNMSSGCIRMMNDDVKDLYDRVIIGTKVIIKS